MTTSALTVPALRAAAFLLSLFMDGGPVLAIATLAAGAGLVGLALAAVGWGLEWVDEFIYS